MKKYPAFLLLVFLSASIQSQVVHIDWVKTFGGELPSIYRDSSKNFHLTGMFYNTVGFNIGLDSVNIESNGYSDIPIIKLDSIGNITWAKSVGGDSYDRGNSIISDNEKNVYTGGVYFETIDIDPGPDVVNINHLDDGPVFIQKLDSSGNFIWANTINGSSAGGYITDDALGNLYVSGVFAGELTFVQDSDTLSLYSNGSLDVFIQKFDQSGNVIWTTSFGGDGSDNNFSIHSDHEGSVYLIGSFNGTIIYDVGDEEFDLISTGASDLYILKIDTNGNIVWAKTISGPEYKSIYSVKTDVFGNVFTVGNFTGTVDFDPSNNAYYLTQSGAPKSFIQKLDANGNFIWVKTIDVGSVLAIDVDDLGNIYITGSFTGIVDFNPGINVYNLSYIGGQDVFILKLDVNGNFIWAQSLGGNGQDKGKDLIVDGAGVIYLSGTFTSWLDFDLSDSVNFIYPSNNMVNIFLLKMTQLPLAVGVNKNTLAMANTRIYPNPSKGHFSIDLGNVRKGSIHVFNLNGQLVYYKEYSASQTIQIDLNEPVGIYYIQLENTDGIEYHKLIIN